MDEVVVYNDGDYDQGLRRRPENDDDQIEYYTGEVNPCHFLSHLLLFLETPPHLRRHLFPIHPNLRSAGTLPSLDMPHHLRADEPCLYREGVSISVLSNPSSLREDETKKKKKKSKRTKKNKRRVNTEDDDDDDDEPIETNATLVDVGLRKSVLVNASIPSNTRVTVKFPLPTSDRTSHSHERYAGASKGHKGFNDENENGNEEGGEYLLAEAINPDQPREEGGYYWGYSLRRASSLSAVFTECRFDEGYDLSVGTSERGHDLDHHDNIFSGSPPPATTNTTSTNPITTTTTTTTTTNTTTNTTTAHDSSHAHHHHHQSIPDQDEKYKEKEDTPFNHILIVFGGPAGIECAIANDPELHLLLQKCQSSNTATTTTTINDNNNSNNVNGCTCSSSSSSLLFDHWINVWPGQGSRTIRTVEAVWIALARLIPPFSFPSASSSSSSS